MNPADRGHCYRREVGKAQDEGFSSPRTGSNENKLLFKRYGLVVFFSLEATNPQLKIQFIDICWNHLFFFFLQKNCRESRKKKFPKSTPPDEKFAFVWVRCEQFGQFLLAVSVFLEKKHILVRLQLKNTFYSFRDEINRHFGTRSELIN